MDVTQATLRPVTAMTTPVLRRDAGTPKGWVRDSTGSTGRAITAESATPAGRAEAIRGCSSGPALEPTGQAICSGLMEEQALVGTLVWSAWLCL